MRAGKKYRYSGIAAVIAISVCLLSLGPAASQAAAGMLQVTSCSAFGDSGTDSDVIGLVWKGIDTSHLSTSNRCPEGGSFQTLPSGVPRRAETVVWRTTAPASIQITDVRTPQNGVLVDPNLGPDGYRADFFWTGGTQDITPQGTCCGGMDFGSGINRSVPPSHEFGWQVRCVHGPCGQPLQILDVRGIELVAQDDTAPSIAPVGSTNIWNERGRWIRGTGWPASFTASDDSGICSMQAVVAGRGIQGPTDSARNTHSWTQCPTPQTMQLTVDSSQYPNGPLTLSFSAGDAASPANVSSPSETVDVDNEAPTLRLSGPTDAPTTAGTQYIDATATAGPSGVAGILCSIDSSPGRWFLSDSARIPVQGLGTHHIACVSENNARDAAGKLGASPPSTWTLSIRAPSVTTVAFERIVHVLRCRPRRERVRIPPRWGIAYHKGHRVHIKLPAQTRTVKVMRCHPRIVRRRVEVNGRWTTQRVVLLPHTALFTTRRLRQGSRARVIGWLGTSTGNGLGGQVVQIYAAPANGSNHFTKVASAKTAANGIWTTDLPAGPSRVVYAVYGGSTTFEPSASAPGHVVVAGSLSLRIKPTTTHWGDRITIAGRLHGGYIPPAGELVVLRVGWPGGTAEVGHLYAHQDGSFSTTYTFLRGNGSERYRFWAATARESDYPYAPTRSRRIVVTVLP